MLGFIYSNQSWVIVIGIIVFLLILYFIFKSLPAKANKKESTKKDDKKSSEETKSESQKQEIVEVKESDEKEEKTQKDEEKPKKDDKKPKIIQVYKRQSTTSSGDGDAKKTVIDPIYDRNVEFVNTSKNIAKFKSFAEEKKEEEKNEENVDDYGFVQDKKDDCEFCEDNVKHFDHSKRLSNIMKSENSDDMFGSHISEKYLNINSDRHLNLNEKFNQQLFSMTDKMMQNSENKVQGDGNPIVSSYFGQNVEEEDEPDEDVKVNMKTALIADTYFKRKKRKK